MVRRDDGAPCCGGCGRGCGCCAATGSSFLLLLLLVLVVFCRRFRRNKALLGDIALLVVIVVVVVAVVLAPPPVLLLLLCINCRSGEERRGAASGAASAASDVDDADDGDGAGGDRFCGGLLRLRLRLRLRSVSFDTCSKRSEKELRVVDLSLLLTPSPPVDKLLMTASSKKDVSLLPMLLPRSEPKKAASRCSASTAAALVFGCCL